jgi:hypothetical protein
MPYFVGEKTDDNMNETPESLSSTSTAFPAVDEYDEQEIPRKKQKRSFSPAMKPSSNEPASTLKEASQDKNDHGSGYRRFGDTFFIERYLYWLCNQQRRW